MILRLLLAAALSGRCFVCLAQGPAPEAVFRNDDRNKMEVCCKGDEIWVTGNGLAAVEPRDPVKPEGPPALQRHAGPPTQAEFR